MTCRWTRSLLALAAVAALAMPELLAAQEPRLGARLDARTLAPVEALLDSARSAGVPTEPLVQKALEGQSKGADGARIVGAVHSLFVNLRAARGVLGPAADDAELAAGAATLRAGAEPQVLAELREMRPDRSLVVPLGVMADLVARGVPLETAWRSVAQLARSGASDAQFVAMRERMERDLGSRGAAVMPPPAVQPRGMPAPGTPNRP